MEKGGRSERDVCALWGLHAVHGQGAAWDHRVPKRLKVNFLMLSSQGTGTMVMMKLTATLRQVIPSMISA